MQNWTMRILRSRLPLVLALAAACLHPGAAEGQIEARRSRPDRGFCGVGRPAESCGAFLVAEGGAHVLLGGSRYTRNDYNNGPGTRSAHLAGYFNWEIGVMVNRGPADAVGATVLAGADPNGLRVGLKGRYRRWMGRHAAVDVGAGLLAGRRAAPFEGEDAGEPGNRHEVVGGLTADAALGLTDWASLSVRGDLLLDRDGTPAHGVYGGLKLGTRPAMAATAAPLVLALVLGLVYATTGGG